MLALAPIRTGLLASELPSPWYWTRSEDRALAEHYPAGGLRACRPLLPRRSDEAIMKRARDRGLRSPLTRGNRNG